MVVLAPASKRLIQVALLAGAAVLAVLGVLYLTESAAQLPSWLPGYDTSLTRHRIKHGAAAIALAADLVAVVWIMAYVAPRGSAVRRILLDALARLRDRDPADLLDGLERTAPPPARPAPRTVVFTDDRSGIDTMSGRGVALGGARRPEAADRKQPRTH